MSAARPFATLALAAALTACTMAPRYERPAAPVPTSYENVEAATASATPASALPASEIGWQEFFPDPDLQALIATALDNNRDLRIATLNVQAARAQYRIQRAELLPPLDIEGTANNQRTPADLSRTGNSELTRVYSAGVNEYISPVPPAATSAEIGCCKRFVRFSCSAGRSSDKSSLKGVVGNAITPDSFLRNVVGCITRTRKQKITHKSTSARSARACL